jgi:cellulose synthase (UDP-forming)
VHRIALRRSHAALKEIGGLGPELAEDHSTTLMMNAFGWRGVHALDAIAHGEGPRTFADLVTQEFQWSRSLVMVLLQYSPTYVARLPLRLKPSSCSRSSGIRSSHSSWR